jgi:hypothetical protein
MSDRGIRPRVAAGIAGPHYLRRTWDWSLLDVRALFRELTVPLEVGPGYDDPLLATRRARAANALVTAIDALLVFGSSA